MLLFVGSSTPLRVPLVRTADESRCTSIRMKMGLGNGVRPLGAAALATVVAAAGYLSTSFPDAAHAYGLEGGRIAKCRGDAPCVSTSSAMNPSKFGPPWSYVSETADADTAWASLKRAIETNPDGGHIVELDEDESKNSYYLRAEFPSFIRGIDDVEFRLLKTDGIVSYRSASRETIYLYPLQTPIDNGHNRARLNEIRATLGWVEDASFE